MSQYTQVVCPNCQRNLRVRKEYSGKVIACKYCEHAFYPKVPIPCPNCGETLNVRIGYLGHRITCKQCDWTFRAPLAEDAAGESHPDTDPALAAALQVARLETAALEGQAEKLRADLAARDSEHSAALEEIRRGNAEATDLRAHAEELQQQLDQARLDLEQASGLREELDAARSSSQLLDVRTRELQERTGEVEHLREQLNTLQAEFQLAGTDLQANSDRHRADAECAGAALAALQAEMGNLTAGHEQHLACLTTELNALHADHEKAAAARDETARTAEELRLRLAEAEAALHQAIQGHAATLEEANSRWESERQALHAQWGARHAASEQGRQQQVGEAQARLDAERRLWEEHDAAARQEIEATRTELERARQEWEARHQDTVAEHQRRLADEQSRAALALQEWQDRHAQAERGAEEERTRLRAELEQA